MKAPDKIYVWPNGIGPNKSTSVYTDKTSEDGYVQYIRKEFLQEWAIQKRKPLESNIDDWSLGFMCALTELWDKLNCM